MTTFSYLPPLTRTQIRRQVAHIGSVEQVVRERYGQQKLLEVELARP